MIGWFLKLIGVSEGLTTRLGETHLMWTRPVLLGVGLVLLVPMAFVVVRRHRRSLAHIEPSARRWLSVCRICVLLLLVLVVGGPYLRLTEDVTRKPVLAILLDESASMQLPAGPFEGDVAQELAVVCGLVPVPDEGSAPSLDADARRRLNNFGRLELAARTLATQEATLLEALNERFDVRLYRAARNTRRVADGDASPNEEPGALDDTDLGSALEDVVDEAAGRDIAGIVIISDGQNTTGPDPLQVVHRYNGAESDPDAVTVPVWTVPVGSATPPADIRVLDVFAPSLVTEGDQANVVATLEASGFAGREVRVELRDGDETQDETTVALVDNQRLQVPLTYEATQSGARLLTVVVDEQPEEQVKQNNRRSVFIDIDTQRRKVLYLEGFARWDFRFLDHALRRDKGLEVSVILEAARQAELAVAAESVATNDTTAAASNTVAVADEPAPVHLPEDAAGFAEYSVVILGDISPAFLPPRAQEQLLKAVREEGVGLIVQAGPQHMPHAFAEGPLGEQLPLQFAAASTNGLGGRLAPGFAPFQMKVEAAGAVHPVFLLYDSAAQNREVWSQMPPFFWAADATGPKPGTTVLASAEHQRTVVPLIAEHAVGRGRVLFIGTDSTYRWRRNIGNHLFYRFWGQTLRHVAGAAEREAGTSWIEATPRRVEPGDPVAIELYTVDRAGIPLADRRVIVSVTAAGQAETLTLDRTDVDGHYRGTWTPRKVDVYRVEYTDARNQAVSAFFQAASSGRELTHPTVDRDMLGNLADAAGGELVELHHLAILPERLRGEPVTQTVTHEEELWDNWLTLLLLVGLYCADVGIRRMLGLT